MAKLIEVVATVVSYFLFVITLPVSLFFCFKVVQEYERAIIFRLGRLRAGGPRGPGTFFILPCIDEYCQVDLRTVCLNVPPQDILTKDSLSIKVDAVAFYRVQDPLCAIMNVVNFSGSTFQLAMATLRDILGTKNLAQILVERESIANTMRQVLDKATDPWGIKVERVEITDVYLPQDLQRAMAAEAEAAREARAKLIAAEGELKAARNLKEAADVITKSPTALQLRYLQTLSNISAGDNTLVVFPLPVDLINKILG